MTLDLVKNLQATISALPVSRPIGRVVGIDDAIVWASGLARHVAIGNEVRLALSTGQVLDAVVIRVRDTQIALSVEANASGVRLGDKIQVLGAPNLSPSVAWIGRIVDPFGKPLDGHPLLPGETLKLLRAPPHPASTRKGLGKRLATGMHLFNTLLPIARGQRIGLFAGSGVGKSRLLAQFAQNLEADVIVLALVGERGRELRDFVETVLGAEGMKRTVVIAATSDRSPMERKRCLSAAMTTAEFFRDMGLHAVLLADSVTRFAEAHREIAFAAGELPTLKGHPASIVQELMSLCERAGPGDDGSGDITAIFTVLVAGSDMENPIADTLRGTLDGHIVLERSIAEKGRYPAVNILKSVSRILPDHATEVENETIVSVRKKIALLEKNENLISTGLYRVGSNKELDAALAQKDDIDNFLFSVTSESVDASLGQLARRLRRTTYA